MSTEIPTNLSQKFRDTLVLLSQQTGSRLRRAVMTEGGTIDGSTVWFDQVGGITANRITSRNTDTPISNIPHRRRRIDMAPYNAADLIDKADKVRMVADPTNIYAKAINSALQRQIDDLIINAFFATAQTGQDGTTQVTFPSANQVAVNSWKFGVGSVNSGLTVSKLLEAKGILDAGEAGTDQMAERWIAVTAAQMNYLLSTTEATSSDYNTVKTLYEGTINRFAGFNFIRIERLTLDGSGYVRVPCWTTNGVYLGFAQDVATSIDKRTDKNNAYQVYGEIVAGAARVEEAAVAEIKCIA